jgi:hypothetical protein
MAETLGRVRRKAHLPPPARKSVIAWIVGDEVRAATVPFPPPSHHVVTDTLDAYPLRIQPMLADP